MSLTNDYYKSIKNEFMYEVHLLLGLRMLDYDPIELLNRIPSLRIFQSEFTHFNYHRCCQCRYRSTYESYRRAAAASTRLRLDLIISGSHTGEQMLLIETVGLYY